MIHTTLWCVVHPTPATRASPGDGQARVVEGIGARAEAGLGAGPVEWYLDRIGRVPLATADEEVELARDIEVGLYAAHKLAVHKLDAPRTADQDQPADLATLAELAERGRAARQRLVEANLRLVAAVAKRYLGRGLALPDLIQEGNLGLIHAVEKFDYQQGNKFSTYAGWWIRQAITYALAERAPAIRVPQHQADRMNSCTEIAHRLAHRLGRPPTCAEIGEQAGLSPERVAALQGIAQRTRQPVSLNTPLRAADGEDGQVLGEIVEDTESPSPPDVAAASMVCARLDALLATLPSNYRQIVVLRYGLFDGCPRGLADIAPELGITAERVRQLLGKALTRLRQHPDAAALAAYIDA